MNAPKVIAIVIVLVIAVALLYDTFNKALPKDFTDAPFDIEMGGSGSDLTVDEDMNLVLTLPEMTFTSHMPQDIKDVKVDVYLGNGNKKMFVGTFDFETMPSETPTTKAFDKVKIPAIMFMAYAGSLEANEEGNINLPVMINIAFKYLDWQGTSLLDLGIGLSLSGTMARGGVSVEHSGYTSTVTVSPEENSLVTSVIQSFKDEFGSTGTITSADGSVTIGVEVDSSGNLKVSAGGTTDTAYALLKDMITDDGVSFNYSAGGHNGTFNLTKEQAEAVLHALEAFYEEED